VLFQPEPERLHRGHDRLQAHPIRGQGVFGPDGRRRVDGPADEAGGFEGAAIQRQHPRRDARQDALEFVEAPRPVDQEGDQK
jgi:hypothetical protein